MDGAQANATEVPYRPIRPQDWALEFSEEIKYGHNLSISSAAHEIVTRALEQDEQYKTGVIYLPSGKGKRPYHDLEQVVPNLKRGLPDPSGSVEIGSIVDPEDPVRKAAGVHERVYGLYATKDLAPYSWFQVFNGHLCTVAEYNQRIDQDLGNGLKYMYAVDHEDTGRAWGLDGAEAELTVDATTVRNETAFVNDYRSSINGSVATRKRPCNVHTLEAVVHGVPRVLYTNSAAIPQGGQLLSDYGEKFWDGYRIAELQQAPFTELAREKEKNAWLEMSAPSVRSLQEMERMRNKLGASAGSQKIVGGVQPSASDGIWDMVPAESLGFQ
eukprot:gene22770-27491_t